MTIYAMGGTVGGSFGEWRLQQIDGHPAQQTSEYSRSFFFGQVRMTEIKRLLAELSGCNGYGIPAAQVPRHLSYRSDSFALQKKLQMQTC